MSGLALALAFAAFAQVARAHDLQPGYLELKQTASDAYEVLWKVPARGEMRLALDPRLPVDCVWLREPVGYFTGDAWVERAAVTRPGGLDGQRIRIDGLAATVTDVVVRVERSDGGVQTARLTAADPSFVVAPSKGWTAVAKTYVAIGFQHILLGVDHLLFVLGLVLIVRAPRTLLATISAFTVAHSLTLAAATLGIAHAPLPPLNAAIALSILFLGPEIVRSWRGETSLMLRKPWLVAFAFGLLHGFGFATGLSTIGIPRREVVQGLLWFNVGVELGQLAFVAAVLAMVRSFRALETRWPAWIERLPGYAIGACGAWWTLERVAIVLAGAR